MPKVETVGNIVIDGKGEERRSTWTITKAKEQRRTSNKAKKTDKEQRHRIEAEVAELQDTVSSKDLI